MRNYRSNIRKCFPENVQQEKISYKTDYIEFCVIGDDKK